MWNSGKSYLHNYHSLLSFSRHHFYQLFHSPGCFTVPDGQLLILAIRDNGVRLYYAGKALTRSLFVGLVRPSFEGGWFE